jgi:hypothetical protein
MKQKTFNPSRIDMVCWCGATYTPRVSDLKRGWALSCCKSHSAIKRSKPNLRDPICATTGKSFEHVVDGVVRQGGFVKERTYTGQPEGTLRWFELRDADVRREFHEETKYSLVGTKPNPSVKYKPEALLIDLEFAKTIEAFKPILDELLKECK